MAAEGGAFALVAVGLGAADIVDDPIPVAVTLGAESSKVPLLAQPSLAELLVSNAEELNWAVLAEAESPAGGDPAPFQGQPMTETTSYSDNYATALVDSPLDSEWCFTTSAYTS